jgi:hypothetical protein
MDIRPTRQALFTFLDQFRCDERRMRRIGAFHADGVLRFQYD